MMHSMDTISCQKCNRSFDVPSYLTHSRLLELCPNCYYQPDHVVDNIYISDYQCPKRLSSLQKHNISHIVVCGEDLFEFFPDDFAYLKFNLDDDEDQIIDDCFQNAFEFISGASNNVLIHCYAGISRSATIVISYLMKYKQITLESALNYLKSKRQIVQPNKGFMEQLRRYEQSLVKSGYQLKDTIDT